MTTEKTERRVGCGNVEWLTREAFDRELRAIGRTREDIERPNALALQIEYELGRISYPEYKQMFEEAKLGDLGYALAPPTVRPTLKQEIAEKIASHIFSDGAGNRAARLALVLPDGRSGGGWGIEPLLDAVLAILSEQGI